MADSSTPTASKSPLRRIAVVGGGISGLAAAHRVGELGRRAGRTVEVTLFEAGPRLGGSIETRRVGEYLVETGADSFITNKPWGADLCRRLGIEERLIPTDSTYRRSLVLRNGRPVAVPEGFMLLAPARIWPVLASPIFTPWGKLRMGLEYFVPRRRDDGDESLAAFVRRRFGREALERLVQPLVGGIYTSDPEKLSLRATMPRFLDMEQRHRSLIRASRKQAGRTEAEEKASGARYGLFATPEGGLSELIDALERRLAEFGTIRRDTAVTALRPASDNAGTGSQLPPDDSATDRSARVPVPVLSWELTLSDGATSEFDAVILALPAYRAADLLAELDPPLAAELREIEYASTSIVVTGHRESDVRHPLDAFGLVVPAVERRKVLAVSFSSRKFPGRAPAGCVQLRTFVGGAMQPELAELDEDELLALVRPELHELLGVGGREEFSLVTRHIRAMPQYHVGHLARVGRIEALTAQHPGLTLAGNAYHGVGLPDCIHSGEQAAERMMSDEG